ncbi:uncharacterized protein LOC144987224 isoform X2 [Oryzias latipes]
MLFDPDPLSNSSTDTSIIGNLLFSYYVQCSILYARGHLFKAFVFTNILLVLLLSTLVFLVAAQRWMKQRRTSSEAANSRQSDAFTFNMVQFLLLTCVEFYLAVVHPVIYLRLKSSGGVWIRGISAAVVWLLCVLGGVVSYRCKFIVTMVLCLCLLVLDLAVVSFCCISVLWTLKRPGPGENAEDKVDPSKQRAFQTILKIMLPLHTG